jgi:hypothetical protein
MRAVIKVRCSRCARAGRIPTVVGLLEPGAPHWTLTPVTTWRPPGKDAKEVVALGRPSVGRWLVDLYCSTCNRSCGQWKARTLADRYQDDTAGVFVPDLPSTLTLETRAAVESAVGAMDPLTELERAELVGILGPLADRAARGDMEPAPAGCDGDSQPGPE